MPVRIKDGIIPYTGGQGIEITNNHVINVLLRKMNNLIHVNGDRELYVDLQLDDGIAPDDDFPVGVTTGKILQEDGWQQSGIILNWKTTSGDYVRLIYANDGKLYYDAGTGTWIEIGAGYSVSVATASSLGVIKLGSDTKQTETPETPSSTANRTYAVQLNNDNQAVVNVPWTDTTYTAGANIVIDQNNVISTTIPQALVYKGNVTDISDLPASGTVGDTYFVEGEDAMYSWDGNQWNYVGGTGIDISNLFNKTIDTSDDITEGSIHLFCTAIEKAYWNGKQDALTAGTGISISSDVISNTLPFEPENGGALGQYLGKTSTGYRWKTIKQFNPSNEGSTGQVLKKTSTGYQWANESGGGGGGGGGSYSAGDGIAITGHTISNTKPFEPGEGTAGQVLTKTANGYAWLSSSSNIKCFEINLLTVTSNELKEIVSWINTGLDYGAIIKNPTQDGIYTYLGVTQSGANLVYEFLGTRYYADTTTTTNGQFSTLSNSGLNIVYDGSTYTAVTNKYNSYANFLKVEDSGYTTAYMPTQDFQPATKKYVDSRNWTGTLTEYNNLQSIDPDVVYNITSLS